MKDRRGLDFWQCAEKILNRMRHGGVLATVVDDQEKDNILTLGWGLLGTSYHEHPIVTIAITPLRYSWRFLESIPEFVLAVPGEGLEDALDLCGNLSGRDLDKFLAAGLTRMPSIHIRPPSILECPINVECRVYHFLRPPHQVLTPEHRERPTDEQHTIYFAEVLGTYGWERA